MYKKISDYGIIGNLRTVALVGLDGSIDWFCSPYIDSPSIFGALLDDQRGGCFAIRPEGRFDSSAEYLPRTNVLVTRFRTRSGMGRLTDFMHVTHGEDQTPESPRHQIYRILEVDRGEIDFVGHFTPRFDYARAETVLESVGSDVVARGGNQVVTLSADVGFDLDGDRAQWRGRLSAGQTAVFRTGCRPDGSNDPPDRGDGIDPSDVRRALDETETFWRQWLNRSETGRAFDYGPYRDMLERSALVLKLLYYAPTGAIAAAATTSLPEKIGGSRNWDYRYTWIRDTSFTLNALFNLGHLSETEGYISWIKDVLAADGASNLLIMYGLRGERDLEETTLDHLDGYKGSRPVRVGNEASSQRQMDIYGELMDAALRLADYVGRIKAESWPMLRSVCDFVCANWREKDYGIWEIRGGPHHFVYSKVMCWAALDRGLTIADRYGFPADRERWRASMDAIRSEVMDRGWNEAKGAFVQHYDTDALDAANLLIPLVGFLDWDDPKTASLVDAVGAELGRDGLLYRYLNEDGLAGDEGAFILCTFWYIDCLVRLDRLDQAETLLRRLDKTANHLGLFAEEYDPVMAESLGNFPQAFTHIGYINAVINLRTAKRGRRRPDGSAETPVSQRVADYVHRKLLASEIELNQGDPETRIPPDQVAARLRELMNVMRGAFFDTTAGRVAYEQMKDSDIYRRFVDAARNLRHFDPAQLNDPKEKTAFWVNLYNVIIIHGVVDLGIRDSVKEVRNIFSRIQYDIGGRKYTPDVMEHGLLRANRRPPFALFRVLDADDPRRAYGLDRVDPRVHFALVCASSSCPPIDLYTAENLDEELDLAAKTFLNAGGLIVRRRRKVVELSRIFYWYAEDFGASQDERLSFLAGFLYDQADRDFISANLSFLQVEYQDYDWRLNRT